MADSSISADEFKKLKHDIRNQLSNIQLALEGMRFEVSDMQGDIALYFDSMEQSAKTINKLLSDIQH